MALINRETSSQNSKDAGEGKSPSFLRRHSFTLECMAALLGAQLWNRLLCLLHSSIDLRLCHLLSHTNLNSQIPRFSGWSYLSLCLYSRRSLRKFFLGLFPHILWIRYFLKYSIFQNAQKIRYFWNNLKQCVFHAIMPTPCPKILSIFWSRILGIII